MLGVTREAIRQLERRALAELAEALGARCASRGELGSSSFEGKPPT
jgi:hypothetical protein